MKQLLDTLWYSSPQRLDALAGHALAALFKGALVGVVVAAMFCGIMWYLIIVRRNRG